MKKTKVGDTVCVFDQKLKNYYGAIGTVSKYIHPYIYAVEFEDGTEGWFMSYQLQKKK